MKKTSLATNSTHRLGQFYRAFAVTSFLPLWACAQQTEKPIAQPEQPIAQAALTEGSDLSLVSDRGGIGLEAPLGVPATPAESLIEQRRSFAVTDKKILSPRFDLQKVLNGLARNSGTSDTPNELFARLWDTQRKPSCPSEINGASVRCDRAESEEATRLADYAPIGLFNRFDLSDPNGAHCGEYRIVFAKTSQLRSGRNFFILEANLPNPRPDLKRVGCRPIAQFWNELGANPNMADRADKLEQFYFSGIAGAKAVLNADHLGAGATGLGQVRTNQFVTRQWSLRELKMVRTCTGLVCALGFKQVTVKSNPIAALFNDSTTELPNAAAIAFQDSVINQLDQLLVPDLNRFNLQVADRFNHGESIAGEGGYRAGSAFAQRLTGALAARASTVTAAEVINRITSLSCAGCHQDATGASLGSGLPPFPDALGFTHVSEFSTEQGEDGERFRISDALTNQFIPHRQRILHGFLAQPVWAAQELVSGNVELCSLRDETLAKRKGMDVAPTSTVLVANAAFGPNTRLEWRYSGCGGCVVAANSQTLEVNNRNMGVFDVRSVNEFGAPGGFAATVLVQPKANCQSILATQGRVGADVQLCSFRQEVIAQRQGITVVPTSSTLTVNGVFEPDTQFEWRYSGCGDCVIARDARSLTVNNRGLGTFRVRSIRPGGLPGAFADAISVIERANCMP